VSDDESRAFVTRLDAAGQSDAVPGLTSTSCATTRDALLPLRGPGRLLSAILVPTPLRALTASSLLRRLRSAVASAMHRRVATRSSVADLMFHIYILICILARAGCASETTAARIAETSPRSGRHRWNALD